jgi:hypothetical protein
VITSIAAKIGCTAQTLSTCRSRWLWASSSKCGWALTTIPVRLDAQGNL